MTHKNWNDNKIENLLGDMPGVSDDRPMSEILARLKQDERLNTPHRKRIEEVDASTCRCSCFARYWPVGSFYAWSK